MLTTRSYTDVVRGPPSQEQSSEQRAGRGRSPCTEMAIGELIRLLDALDAAEIPVWVDGGWGVDALFGVQRRQHDDLDLVVEMKDVSTLQRILRQLNYTFQHRNAPLSFELVDPDGRQVDIHPVTFNEHGDGVYQMDGGKSWTYPAEGLAGRGEVGGRPVRCLTPELQMRVHSGYELAAKDHDEVRDLQERFGVDPPEGYARP
jgi:lincosamide nucleotidyltransferase A/C/D/E